MTITHWNQVAATVEQLPEDKQEVLATFVALWLSGLSTEPESPGEITGRRRAGSAAGQFVIPAEFDDPLPDEILAAFEGRL